jgi:DNA-binding transcriptional LysR family regulator
MGSTPFTCTTLSWQDIVQAAASDRLGVWFRPPVEEEDERGELQGRLLPMLPGWPSPCPKGTIFSIRGEDPEDWPRLAVAFCDDFGGAPWVGEVLRPPLRRVEAEE